MEFVKEVVMSNIISQFDQRPTNYGKEKKFLAFMLCNNLTDLCRKAVRILRGISVRGMPMNNLPDINTISICEGTISMYFSESMFIIDEDRGALPNWRVINAFSADKTEIACKLYRAISKNMTTGEEASRIQKAVQTKNKDYFVKNFDKIFKDVPFTDGLKLIKNFVISSHVTEKDQEDIWEFFDSLLDIFINEESFIAELKSL